MNIRLVAEMPQHLRFTEQEARSFNPSPVSTGPSVGFSAAVARRTLFHDYESLGRQSNVQSQSSIGGDTSVKGPSRSVIPPFQAAAPGLWPGSSCAGASARLPEHPGKDQPRLRSTAGGLAGAYDRFVPRRRGANLDWSYFQVVRQENKPRDDAESNFLDLFEEVERATKHWRKSYMEVAFEASGLFRDARKQRILNISDGSSQGCGSWKGDKKCEFRDESQWRCRPRKQPLLNVKGENSKRYRDHGAQIFRFSKPIRFKNLIDWSSSNVLIAGLVDTMCLCCVDFKSLSKVYRLDYDSYISCLKWNKPGTFAGISGMDSSTSLYDAKLKTVIWKRFCSCHEIERKVCKVVDMVWANKHEHLITACDMGKLTILSPRDGKTIETKDFGTELLAISLSPQEQYLVESGNDQLVKVFHYPQMIQLFEIAFFTYVKALAWHPWMTGMLCIGGGPGDGSLSLWNVNTQSQLGYRKVRFVGCVDSMLFNQLSGELVVHWYYLEDDRLHSKIVVMASLDKVVDAVPVQPNHKILNVLWSPDHTKLAMQYRETFLIWDFFGNDVGKWLEKEKAQEKEQPREFLEKYVSTCSQSSGSLLRTVAGATVGKRFSHFNIR